jgi:hypothetical protein
MSPLDSGSPAMREKKYSDGESVARVAAVSWAGGEVVHAGSEVVIWDRTR